MKQKQNGFTLVELLVSVALMLILVGAVIMIFKDSSEVFSVSDAKMAVYQNARAAFELMARELTSADNSGNPGTMFVLCHKPKALNSQDLFQFRTTTSWVDGGRKSGTAIVTYSLEYSTDTTLWNLVRKVNVGGKTLTNVLAQYIPVDTRSVRIGYFKYDTGVNNWVYMASDQPNKSDAEVVAGTKSTFSAQSPTYGPNLPDAIRLTITFTDRQRRVYRTISRTIWLPKSTINS